MSLEDDLDFVGRLLDEYAKTAWRKSLAGESTDDSCVPLDMQFGEVDDEGWVEWRLLPSTLGESDLSKMEDEFRIGIPPLFRAYLLARCHLFDQVRSRKHNQQILMTPTPSNRPLEPFRSVLSNWVPLIDAGYLPFADCGDGWGPMCFDQQQRRPDDDCPIVWFDHERLVPLGEDVCRQRDKIQDLAQPIFASCREFLIDVFGTE